MGKTLIVIDTSAIISLGCAVKFHLVKRIFGLHCPTRVKEELEEISRADDEIGKIAKEILNYKFIKYHKLPANLKSILGEVESVNLAIELKAKIIIMDDAKSMKKLEAKTDIPILFSSFVIYSLVERKIISHEEGLSAIENMKAKRQWKDNLIIEYAKFLFEKDAK